MQHFPSPPTDDRPSGPARSSVVILLCTLVALIGASLALVILIEVVH